MDGTFNFRDELVRQAVVAYTAVDVVKFTTDVVES